MEPTGKFRRAVCIAAVALVMTAGTGCRAARVADDTARVADDAGRAGKNDGKTSKYIRNGAEMASKLQDANGGSEDEQSK